MKPLDREKESYFTFPIYVRDGGYPERTAFAAVSIFTHPCFGFPKSVWTDHLDSDETCMSKPARVVRLTHHLDMTIAVYSGH